MGADRSHPRKPRCTVCSPVGIGIGALTALCLLIAAASSLRSSSPSRRGIRPGPPQAGTRLTPPPQQPAQGAATAPAPVEAVDDPRIAALQSQMAQLQAANAQLTAALKEAQAPSPTCPPAPVQAQGSPGHGWGETAVVVPAGAPPTLSTLPPLPSPLPALLAAYRRGRLDWHDVVNPAPAPADPGLFQLVKAEHESVALLQGYSNAYTGGRGPWEKHLACPVLADPCMVHGSARECLTDDLCGWCGPRGLCVDVGKVWRSTPVRGKAAPLCPTGLWVSTEAAGTLQGTTPAGAFDVKPLKAGTASATPWEPTSAQCKLVVHRYRPAVLHYTGNAVMSFHFLFEMWVTRFKQLMGGAPDPTHLDPRLHFWYRAGSKHSFWEFFNTASDACYRELDSVKGRRVCYRADPLPMDAPITPVQLPPAEELGAMLGLTVPFGGVGDWPDTEGVDTMAAVGFPGLPPLPDPTAPLVLESPALTAALGALPSVEVKGLKAEDALVRIMGLQHLHSALRRPVLTLISRRNKRLILNEGELVGVARGLGMEVQLVALEKMPLYDQMTAFRRTTVFVGIHGSGLSNSIFLPQGAAVVQLMPFGVKQGGNFFRSPAAGAGAKYSEWKNPVRGNTVTHWEFMGDDQQGKAEEVMKKGDNCCGQATFFSFWINQDTYVDPEEFTTLLQGALKSPLNVEVLGRGG